MSILNHAVATMHHTIKTEGCGFIIRVDNSFDVYDKDGCYTLDELKEAINVELIEIVRLKDDMIFVCDEEGSFKPNNLNAIATQIFRKAYNDPTLFIFGDVILCDTNKVE